MTITKKNRFHKFYEILDHEHEKQEQVKFRCDMVCIEHTILLIQKMINMK